MIACRILFCIVAMGFFQTSHAAYTTLTKNFSESLARDFSDFESIDYNTLERMIQAVPEQTTLWGCGLHQCGHIVSCANHNGDGTHKLNLNYQEPNDYPLSVNINPGKLKLNIPGLITDEEGNFRVGPVPAEMADFINQQLPASCSFSAKAESNASLSSADLIKIVRDNLALNMPTLVYYMVDANKKIIHFYSIVGVNDSTDAPEFMVLDTKGVGIARLKKFSVEAFHKNMNTQSIVGFVKGLDQGLLGFMIRGLAASQKGSRIVSSSKLGLWENFSVIRFVENNSLPNAEIIPEQYDFPQ